MLAASSPESTSFIIRSPPLGRKHTTQVAKSPCLPTAIQRIHPGDNGIDLEQFLRTTMTTTLQGTKTESVRYVM